jgi:hypothetical protein
VATATAWDWKRRAPGTIRTVMTTHRIGTDRTVAEALSRIATDGEVKKMLGFYDYSTD